MEANQKHKGAEAVLVKHLLPLVYRMRMHRPLKRNKVVFVEMRVGTLSNNFRLLYQHLKEDYRVNIHIHYLENTTVDRKTYLKRCIRMLSDIADAGTVFVNDGNRPLSSVPLREGTFLCQTWHACGAFKRFGSGIESAREEQRRFPSHNHYSLATVSSQEVVPVYEEAFACQDRPGVVKPLGVSRTDVYFDEDFVSGARRRVEKFFPEAKDKKILLYAPTFRGDTQNAVTPDRLNIAMLRDHLADRYVLLIRHHFLVKEIPQIPKDCQTFAMDCSKELTIEESLCAADLCITDYSSLIFEYALLERPMIFYTFDEEEYEESRGFYYPLETFTPGPVCSDNEELIRAIEETEESFQPDQVRQFKNRFMGACDGHATERILDCVFERYPHLRRED